MKPVRLWIGLVLLVLGTFLALDVLDAGTTIDRWWPAALSGLGVVAMLTQGRVSLGPALLTVLGLILLADTNDWAAEDLIGPALLITIGVVVLAGVGRHRTHDHLSRAPVALFGEAKTTDHGEHFEHSTVSAVFGGATLDLRRAHRPIRHSGRVRPLRRYRYLGAHGMARVRRWAADLRRLRG